MASSTPEGKVKEKIKRLLKHYGAWYYLPVSLDMGQHGIPDFVCCYNGQFFGIEAKAEGKKPTPLQVKQAETITKAGGKWFLVDGDDSLMVVEKWLKGM